MQIPTDGEKSPLQNPDNDAIIKRATKAERVVRKACRLIHKHNKKLFPRYVAAKKSDALDRKQIDILLETCGSISVEIQVKSTENALRKFYRKRRNHHILVLNPYHYGEDITAAKLKPTLEELVLYAISHPFESPCDWYYHKEYNRPKPPE